MGDCSSCKGSCSSQVICKEDDCCSEMPAIIRYKTVNFGLEADQEELKKEREERNVIQTFEVGDRVYCTGTGERGRVIKIKHTMYGIQVDGKDPKFTTYFESRHLISETQEKIYKEENQRIFAEGKVKTEE